RLVGGRRYLEQLAALVDVERRDRLAVDEGGDVLRLRAAHRGRGEDNKCRRAHHAAARKEIEEEELENGCHRCAHRTVPRVLRRSKSTLFLRSALYCNRGATSSHAFFASSCAPPLRHRSPPARPA